MKRNYLAILLLCALTGIYSCDYISNPLEDVVVPVGDCETQPFPTTKPHRKVLVEDYTGHQCSNCPQAAVSAHKLEELFHDSVIIVGVHAGFFAKIDTKKGYVKDFRTAAGDDYAVKFNDAEIYPSGFINRKDFLAGKAIKAHSSWASEVNSVLHTPIEADIKMLTDYNAADSNVCVSIQTTFLRATPATGKYNLCVMLLQDSIVAAQLDGSLFVNNYLHRHVLRANINGTWGEEILNGSAVINEPILKKYKFKLKPEYGYDGKLTPKGEGTPCVVKNCYVVAFVYESGPTPISYRILQAEEVKIIK